MLFGIKFILSFVIGPIAANYISLSFWLGVMIHSFSIAAAISTFVLDRNTDIHFILAQQELPVQSEISE